MRLVGALHNFCTILPIFSQCLFWADERMAYSDVTVVPGHHGNLKVKTKKIREEHKVMARNKMILLLTCESFVICVSIL